MKLIFILIEIEKNQSLYFEQFVLNIISTFDFFVKLNEMIKN